MSWVEYETRPADAFELARGGKTLVLEWIWNGTAQDGLLLSLIDPDGAELRFEGGPGQPQRAEVVDPSSGSWYPQAHPRGPASDVTYTVYVSVFYGAPAPPGYSALRPL